MGAVVSLRRERLWRRLEALLDRQDPERVELLRTGTDGGDMGKVYTVTQVAELVGCSREQVARSLRDGRATGFKIGKQWRMTDGDVSVWIGRDIGEVEDPEATALLAKLEAETGLKGAELRTLLTRLVDRL
jgi:excisionase family DNA binding protein